MRWYKTGKKNVWVLFSLVCEICLKNTMKEWIKYELGFEKTKPGAGLEMIELVQ